MTFYKRSLVAVALAVAASAPFAEQRPTELPGAEDPALISRYAGSVLVNAAIESFASVRVPAGPGRYGSDGHLAFDKSTTVEGPLRGYYYVAPKDRTALEVFRNYQLALSKNGATTLYSCELRACDDARIREPFPDEALRSRRWADGRLTPAASITREIRFVSTKIRRNGADAFVMVFVGEPGSIWEAASVAVVVAEPAPMEAGKVSVSTELRKSLLEEGRIALYGIYFDTGRAELKPESKTQLDEMAALLNRERALKVTIVGHTDNEGGIESNLALSQRRADAVVATLVSNYRIDAARLKARGLANFAPVATNRTDAGRAKNRRVELVEQ